MVLPPSTTAPTRPLGKLLRDTGGNTLAILAGAMFPLLGMVGSAVDASRLYLVKTRLQQACDAGALAARRTMTNNTLDAPARAQAQNFFEANLRSDAYGATDMSFVVSDVMNGPTASGRVAGRANATLPLAIMGTFGFDPVPLAATCEAELNVTNNDVMFVLDVTGSMACLPTDTTANCDSYVGGAMPQDAQGNSFTTTKKANSRIDGLRAAVKSFFTTLDDATTDEARLRIGFVPYASGVNVADILPTGAMVTGTAPYHSRVANMRTSKHLPEVRSRGAWSSENFGSTISSANCDRYGRNEAFSQDNGTKVYTPSQTGNPAPTLPEVTGGNKPADRTQTEYRRKSGTYTGNATCAREKRTLNVTYTTSFAFTNWTYKLVDYNVGSKTMPFVKTVPPEARVRDSDEYSGQELAVAQTAGTASGMTIDSISRTDGCVEERRDGMDDVHAKATSEGSKWTPTWRPLVYLRNGKAEETTTANYPQLANGLPYACPRPAQRLRVLDQGQVNAYVDSPTFLPLGYTYHDIGMVWGARLMSQVGIVAEDHVAAPNGRPVARHIIFMTDGDMKPQTQVYSPFGPEVVSRRRQPTGTLNDATLKTAHNAAFLNACAAARQNNVAVWVVAFGQALTADLRTCAGDANRTFQANNTADLNAQFQSIARRIAELRLSR